MDFQVLDPLARKWPAATLEVIDLDQFWPRQGVGPFCGPPEVDFQVLDPLPESGQLLR